MSAGLLLKSAHQAIVSVVPKILSVQSVQNILAHRIHCICNRQRLSYSSNKPLNHNTPSLLQPILPIYNSICGMKVKGRLQLRCKNCYYITRHERLYVMCKTHPRHKQTQMKKREYKTWILTSASQSKVRGW